MVHACIYICFGGKLTSTILLAQIGETMEGIRLATDAEVEAIREDSDLGPGCQVWTLPGAKPITGVIRTLVEVDPVHLKDASNSHKAMFMWGIENMLRFTQVPFYYFNVLADEEEDDFRKLLTSSFGAEKVSRGAEFRYKKTL